ncbi:Heterokaryon incompatibility protein 6, OR allele [Cytospora mali]|uniref:Heterokaryon incompatibility protein 6, OR allele n=1 Tax=Cytospora mali TaxID=578113 RepID=A0A194URA2_CYTMA|nr:Heterokaryon incompatibility protein 6, OR allele [Valsa mali var. pyri (nom. inval.)]
MASSIWNTSNFYTHLHSTTLAKSFELAKASKAIPKAVNTCDELQGFVDADDLGPWASKTEQIRTSSLSYNRIDQTGIYRPITNPFEIRVLHLKPGKGTEKLQGALHHCSIEFTYEARALIPTSTTGPTQQPITSHATSLEDPSQLIWYTALSYTWGSPVFDASIEPDRSGIIWIDQICINQDDLEEKALQIPLMSRIYDHALNTVIWLGPSLESDLSTNAFDVLEHCATNLQFLEDIDCPNDFESIDACNRLQASGVSYWLTKRSSDSKHRANNPLDIDVCRTIVYLSSAQDRKKAMAKEGLKPYDFLRTLEDTRYALCYDPRDKIYGLLGLGPGKGLDLEVRYDEVYTAIDLHFDIGVRMLSMDRLARDNLDTLLECVDHDQTKTDLPSWVPDWSRPRRTISIGLGLGGGEMGIKNFVSREAFDTVTNTTPLLENPDLTLDNP